MSPVHPPPLAVTPTVLELVPLLAHAVIHDPSPQAPTPLFGPFPFGGTTEETPERVTLRYRKVLGHHSLVLRSWLTTMKGADYVELILQLERSLTTWEEGSLGDSYTLTLLLPTISKGNVFPVAPGLFNVQATGAPGHFHWHVGDLGDTQARVAVFRWALSNDYTEQVDLLLGQSRAIHVRPFIDREERRWGSYLDYDAPQPTRSKEAIHPARVWSLALPAWAPNRNFGHTLDPNGAGDQSRFGISPHPWADLQVPGSADALRLVLMREEGLRPGHLDGLDFRPTPGPDSVYMYRGFHPVSYEKFGRFGPGYTANTKGHQGYDPTHSIATDIATLAYYHDCPWSHDRLRERAILVMNTMHFHGIREGGYDYGGIPQFHRAVVRSLRTVFQWWRLSGDPVSRSWLLDWIQRIAKEWRDRQYGNSYDPLTRPDGRIKGNANRAVLMPWQMGEGAALFAALAAAGIAAFSARTIALEWMIRVVESTYTGSLLGLSPDAIPVSDEGKNLTFWKITAADSPSEGEFPIDRNSGLIEWVFPGIQLAALCQSMPEGLRNRARDLCETPFGQEIILQSKWGIHDRVAALLVEAVDTGNKTLEDPLWNRLTHRRALAPRIIRATPVEQPGDVTVVAGLLNTDTKAEQPGSGE